MQMTLDIDPWFDARSAVMSRCGLYRYRLGRRWGEGPQVLWICLNPSVADASIDDPTLRRLVGFSRASGFGSLALGNLFALRSTDPKALYSAADPVGPENDEHLAAMAAESSLIVGAWGVGGSLMDRGRVVRTMFSMMKVLGLTRHGMPRHPLYMPASAQPVEWHAKDDCLS